MSGYIGISPVPQSTQTRDSFTATSGQTSFATGGYTPDFIDVYLNGVKLAAADYTATNSVDVVLSTGAALNDILETVAFTTFQSANNATLAQGAKADAALPKTGGAMTGAITTSSTFDGRDVATDGTKLDGIEASADVTDTTNVTSAGALMDSEVTNLAQVKAFSSADYATASQGTTADNALPKSGGALTGAVTTSSTFDGRNVSVDGTKLDGIETGATADQTAAQIKTAYESNANTNEFSDAEQTKLSGVEASADVTDTTNVTAAGALMDSEVTNLAQVKSFSAADYATAAQGTLAANALPKGGGAMTGAITTSSTFDGRDVSVDGAKLDGIATGATNTVGNATHTGEVTGSGALTIANDVVDAGNLKVTGNGTTSQYLRSDGDGTFTWATPPNTTYSVGDGGLTQINFTSADNTKLDGIAAGATNTVGNATHTGEVTGSGALTIADNIVDEANLKVSNAPTNGYFLSAQSGNTGGLTWAEAGGSTTWGAVGTYAFAQTTGTVYNISAGSTTRSGSSIRPHGFTVYNTGASYTGNHHWPSPGTAPGSGTWQAMGGTGGNWAGGAKYTTTLWVRIS